jgi:transposase-like protein
MPRRPRRNHSAAFKAKVALAAIQGDKTLSQLAEEFEVHANQIVEWKKHLLAEAASVFGAPPIAEPVDLKPLHAKIGQLTLENDFLETALTKAGLLSVRK